MGTYLLGLLAMLAAAEPAPPSPEQAADAARTVALNRAIQQNNDAILDRNKAAEAAYSRDREAYEAAKAQNDRETATAAAAERAYQADRAVHEAAMAQWRETTRNTHTATPVGEDRPVAANAAPRKPVCREEAVAGSLVRHIRRCH